MTKVEEGEEDEEALPINRVDLLPRQFVRSHFGTLLEERLLLSSQQDTSKDDKKGNKARMAAANTASYNDHDNDPYQMDCHFQRTKKLPEKEQSGNAFKMDFNHQITME